MLFERNPAEYYQCYLADTPIARDPQTQPMAIGSAFDARVKNYLGEMIYDSLPDDLVLEQIFDTQVDPQWRDWAWLHSEHVFTIYRKSGALETIAKEISRSKDVRFESRIKRTLNIHGTDVVLVGIPDVSFSTLEVQVILDWKVNGYCSTYNTSPTKGYVALYDDKKGTFQTHKDAVPTVQHGFRVDTTFTLEQISKQWATQLCIYNWLLQETTDPVKPLIVGIDQIVCKGQPSFEVCINNIYPELRVATYRNLLSEGFQENLKIRILDMWQRCHNGWIFKDMSHEESLAKCRYFDKPRDDKSEWLRKL